MRSAHFQRDCWKERVSTCINNMCKQIVSTFYGINKGCINSTNEHIWTTGVNNMIVTKLKLHPYLREWLPQLLHTTALDVTLCNCRYRSDTNRNSSNDTCSRHLCRVYETFEKFRSGPIRISLSKHIIQLLRNLSSYKSLCQFRISKGLERTAFYGERIV